MKMTKLADKRQKKWWKVAHNYTRAQIDGNFASAIS